MESVYFINLKNIKIEETLDKLHSLGYRPQYMNEISFCPYLIVHKNFEKNKEDYVYENINIGLLERLKSYFNVVEDTDVGEFITHASEIKKEKTVTGLF